MSALKARFLESKQRSGYLYEADNGRSLSIFVRLDHLPDLADKQHGHLADKSCQSFHRQFPRKATTNEIKDITYRCCCRCLLFSSYCIYETRCLILPS